MLAAVGSFSLMDAVMKSLTESYPPMQVAALRGLSAMPLVCAYVLWRREVPQLLQVRWPLHLFRGVIGVAMLYLFAYGVQRLTLTDAYAISFIAPLIITILAVPFLKETVHLRHWICLFGGLAGVLVLQEACAGPEAVQTGDGLIPLFVFKKLRAMGQHLGGGVGAFIKRPFQTGVANV